MKRRWIIRSFFIGLLLLCVGGWAASYGRGARIDFSYKLYHTILWDYGRIAYFESESSGERFGPRLTSFNVDSQDWVTWDEGFNSRGLGFCFYRNTTGWEFLVPLWFPTTLSALLLLLVWRKTRSKPKGRAFPVELKAKEIIP